MDKYIGFDIDDKKTVACTVQKGKKDKYATFATGIEQMKRFLKTERQGREKLHLTFEISGQAGYRGSWWKIANRNWMRSLAKHAMGRLLLSIMRAMQLSGELFNERLVCNECGVGKIGKVKDSALRICLERRDSRKDLGLRNVSHRERVIRHKEWGLSTVGSFVCRFCDEYE